MISSRMANEVDDAKKSSMRMIDVLKSAGENLINNRKSIVSLLDIFKDGEEILEEDDSKPNVVIDSPDGRIELKIDLSRKEVNEYVDSDYNMVHFKSAVNDIKTRLAPIADMEAFFMINKAQLREDETGEYRAELNRKTYWMVNELYHSQDPIQRDIIVLDTNLTKLKDPDFRICDFYFKGQYRTTENRIYQAIDEDLQDRKNEYLLKRSEIMWNISDAKEFTGMMRSNVKALFETHHNLLLHFNTRVANGDGLKDLEDEVVNDLEEMFKYRVKIAENIQLILREINAFEDYRSNFQQFFEDAEKEIGNIDSPTNNYQDTGFNAEEYFRSKQKEAKDKSMQLAIEEKLASGDISMSDIEEPELADKIMSEPLLTSQPFENFVARLGVSVMIIIGCLAIQ